MTDREKVIKGLEICSEHGSWHGLDCVLNGAYKDCPYRGCKTGCIITIAKDAIALLKEQEWHLLTEDVDGFIHGLPGDDGRYFMTDGKDIWIDDYTDGVADGVILDSGRDIREITAWMYMPELPKKDRG